MKIMIVEDDRTTRKIFGLYLNKYKYDAVFAENGIEAIEKLASNDVDLIVTDLNMPFMDGFELICNLKKDPSLKKIPILITSIETDEAEREKGFKAGADAYLVKPMSSVTFINEINKLLGI
jgi:two-component system chemotaxis response regulator CheY